MNPEAEMLLMTRLAELQDAVKELKARPMPQIVQPNPLASSQNPQIQQAIDVVALMKAIKDTIPIPPPQPTLKDKLEEMKMLIEMASGLNGGYDLPDTEMPEQDGGFLRDILELAKMQQNIPHAPSAPAKPPTPPALPEAKKEGDTMEKSEFMKYADTLIAELKPAEIDALKLAPKEMIKSKLKSARPEMTDADFEYAYKKVLAL